MYKKDVKSDAIAAACHEKIVEFAGRGFRALGVARADGDGAGGATTEWHTVGECARPSAPCASGFCAGPALRGMPLQASVRA